MLTSCLVRCTGYLYQVADTWQPGPGHKYMITKVAQEHIDAVNNCEVDDHEDPH